MDSLLAKYEEVGPDFVFVTDPDGVRVQISTPEWTG